MNTATTESRSSDSMENLQELLDTGHTSDVSLEQYFTPPELAAELSAKLPARTPITIFDPSCGTGALLASRVYCLKFGIELDETKSPVGVNVIHGNCMKVFEAIEDVAPDLRFVAANANPPFGRKWRMADGSMIDSTLATWRFVTRHAKCGYFIANANTIEKFDLQHGGGTPDIHVTYYERRAANKIWAGLRDGLEVGLIVWKRDDFDTATFTPPVVAQTQWAKIKGIIDEEKLTRPKFNIYITRDGFLKTYLSQRTTFKKKLTKDQIARLHRINDAHPLALTTEKETRLLMRELVGCGLYTVEPAAQEAIEKALAEVNAIACPIMPVSDFETVAYTEEEEALVCNRSIDGVIADGIRIKLTAGRSYPLSTGSYEFSQEFTRNKVHFDEETKRTYTAEHKCVLSGADRYISLKDDKGREFKWMDRPREKQKDELPEALMWDYFNKPKVDTVAEVCKEQVAINLAVLNACEIMAGYKYFDGQLNYLSRVAVKDSALVAGAVGCHAKGAKILMVGGAVKNVEDIRPGELIQGWDNTPRLVHALRRGRDQMVRIVPVKGEPFVVNINHILTLVRTNMRSHGRIRGGEVIDVSVKEWLTWSKAKKNMYKLFRVGVDSWPEQPQPIYPYFVGLLIGDGSLTTQIGFSKPDKETENYLRGLAKKFGWGIRESVRSGNGNSKTFYISDCQSLYNALGWVGLLKTTSGDKFIPEIYKRASRKQRLELLAGLMDTDGSASCGGYDYISKSQDLAEDVAFVARSVGLAAYVAPCTKGCQNGFIGQYFRVSISGDCSIIPCKIERKKHQPRKQKKSVLRTGFSVELLEEGDYYGFTISTTRCLLGHWPGLNRLDCRSLGARHQTRPHHLCRGWF